MAIRIWDGVDQGKTKSLWGSQSISNINSIINNNLPENAVITKVVLKVYGNIDTIAANVYLNYGFSTNTTSIGKELSGGDQKVDFDSACLPSSGIDITSYMSSKTSPFAITTAHGGYFVAHMHTTNVIFGSSGKMHIDNADLEITYTVHTHAYTSSVISNPTCDKAGTRRYTCSCGAYYDESIPALGHSYVDTVTPPTCTAQGYTTHVCSRCGHSYTDTYVAAKGHSWVNATCNTPKTCSVCGATEGSALGHSYTSAITKQPTCTEKGIKTFTCQHDSSHKYTEEIAPLGHDYSITEKVDPTGSEKGYTRHTCSRCGDFYDDTFTYLITINTTTPEGGTVSGGGIYGENESVTLKAQPNADWRVAEWLKNGVHHSPEYTHSYTFSAKENATYTVIFKREYFSLSFDYNELVPAYDVELVSGKQNGSMLKFAEGSVVKVTPKFKQGYTLSHWEDGSTDNPRLVTITGDTVLSVVAKKKEPEFTSVQMLYQNKQISEENKVLAGEFFRIVVSVE